MNKKRRDALRVAIDHLDEALEIVDSARFDEKYAFKSLTEGLQNTERGEAMEEAIDNLMDARYSIKDAKRSIGLAIE